MSLQRLFLVFFVCLSACTHHQAKTDYGTKRIVLSFDDAPRGDGPRFTGEARTKALIVQLTEAETGPVAMFVTTQGFNALLGKQRILDYVNAGHIIANHSDKHMWASRTDIADYIADIDLASRKLEDVPNIRAWYRFPFLDEGGFGKHNRDGLRRDALRSALDERGLINAYVTIDTYDWHLEQMWSNAVEDERTIDMSQLSKLYVAMVLDAVNHYDALAIEVLGRRPAQVLLLHENDLAASFTVDMVHALRDEGWTIIHPDEAYSDPIAKQIPETLFSGMGRVAALAADKGLRGADVFDHWSASENGIAEKADQFGVFGD